MKQVTIGERTVPAVIQGCMRIGALSVRQVQEIIDLQLELGVHFWDHADIYGGGSCERIFGEAISGMPGVRDKLIIQSKCAIRPGEYTKYDFSKEYIINSVEGSLKRLQTDHLDYLLLHRPDLLMEPEEVAEAFDLLEKQGKVLHFGVSNHTPGQIELLKTCVKQPIEVNQLQFSLVHTLLLDAPAYLNTTDVRGINRDAGVLDYCRCNHITIQCYSPFQYGVFEGTFLDNPDYPELNEVLERLAVKYDTTVNGIAVAWILRHPAGMQAVVGTTNPKRLPGIAKGADIELTRGEWYELYKAAGNQLP
ncbi:MAG: aldo/keto reductase family oxidoreductase [Lachnospiraceae bacterium]